MEGKKRAAFDELMEQPLADISAADLLELMQERADVAQAINTLPEKKKVELEVEPILPKFKLGDLVAKFRNEKKKVEYEVEPLMRSANLNTRFKYIPEWKKAAYEVDDFIGSRVIDPVVLESLMLQLEERLVARLKAKGIES